MEEAGDRAATTPYTAIDINDPDVFACPYAAYDALRDTAAIVRGPRDRFVVTSFSGVLKGLTDATHLSRDLVGFFDPNRPTRSDLIWRSSKARDIFREEGWDSWPHAAILFSDPPLHTRYRKLVEPMFSVRRVRETMPFISACTHRLIDAFVVDGETDLAAALAVPLPMAVITHMLGLPEEDLPRLKKWSNAMGDAMSGFQDEAAEIACARSLVACQHYFAHALEERRRRPTSDILTEIAEASADPANQLGEGEILSLISSILIGGNESTTNALTSGVWLMLQAPQVYQDLRREPALLRPFVEEVLRLESPFQFFTRAVRARCAFNGATFDTGDLVDLCLGAANRDPEQYPDPARLDLRRRNSAGHLAFGAGIHRCPGNVLARFELHYAFGAIIERLDDLRLSPKNRFTRMRHPIFRGLEELHVEFTPSEGLERRAPR